MINMIKCYFMQENIVYLGFVISDDGLRMDLKKVKEILEWPIAKNVNEVRPFHSLASFYRKFMRNSSSICNYMIETMRRYKNEFK